MLAFLSSPIIWSSEMVNQASTVMRLNPLTHLFAIWREPLATGHVAMTSITYVLAGAFRAGGRERRDHRAAAQSRVLDLKHGQHQPPRRLSRLSALRRLRLLAQAPPARAAGRRIGLDTDDPRDRQYFDRSFRRRAYRSCRPQRLRQIDPAAADRRRLSADRGRM